jgi:hypothetical protein
MMKFTVWALSFLAFLFLAITVLVLRPVPQVSEDNCLVAKGTIISVMETGVNDILFKLEGDKTAYYINRGLEQGLNLDSLWANVRGKEAILKYPKYWTPLDPNNSLRHLAKVEIEGEVIFSEFR